MHVAGSAITLIAQLNRMGALNRSELMSILAHQRIICKKADLLLQHAEKHSDQRHLVVEVHSPRAFCVKCGATGYYALPQAWLGLKCSGALPSDLGCTLQPLLTAKALAYEWVAALRRLLC